MNSRIWLLVACLEAVAIAALWFALQHEVEPSATAKPQAVAPMAARDSGAATAPEPMATSAPGPAVEPRTEGVAVELPAGALVHGRLRTADGSPLPSWAFVGLFARGESKSLYESRLENDRRTYAWPLVPPGDYELRTRADGVQPVALPVVVPAGAAELRVDVELVSSWLVKVLLLAPDGRPFHEVQGELVRQRPELRLHLGGDGTQVLALWHEVPAALPLSDLRSSPMSVGTWRSSRGFDWPRGRVGGDLPERYAGVLELPERRAAHVAVVLKEQVLARGALAPGQAELELTVDPAAWIGSLATLRLQVVDQSGKPVPTAKIGVNDAQSWGQPRDVDGEGRFEQAHLLPGRFELSVNAPGVAMVPYSVRLAPGAVTDLGQLVVQPQRTVTVVVRDAPEGERLSASVQPLDPAPHAELAARSLRLSLDRGKGTVGLVDGRYRLVVSGRGGARVEFDTRTLGEAPLEVTLQPEATLEIDPTAAAGPTRLLLRSADGAVVLDRWVTWRTRWRQQLLPGTYSATIQPLQGAAREQLLVVGPEGGFVTL
ncbi:MAG: hypothetical protein JNK49_18895 [Planctomycetes bacterium]|nr:hypothetical protein [Planctomycetota bacterium]